MAMVVSATVFMLPLLLLLWPGGGAGVGAAPVINAPWGQIQGRDGVSPTGGAPYSVYHAIPYALPPTGDRRFSKPQPHPGPGVGTVFNGTQPGPICPQASQSEELASLTMSEDCLTLNVYVPASAGSNPSTGAGLKSVMLWIHGGGFVSRSAREFTPGDLITGRDVIVVVIQYRLGVLGFLSSGDDVIRGNFGLWDQALALQWVLRNIGAFGGDPNSLTVFGVSAGAASVGHQVLSPANKDVPFRAVLQSGTPLSSFALTQDPGKAFTTLANRTGCLSQAMAGWTSAIDVYRAVTGAQQRALCERVLDCLRTKDAQSLVQAVNQIPGTWLPVVDDEFIPRLPADMLSDVNYLADVGVVWRDVIVGMTNEEGAAFVFVPPGIPQENQLLANQGQSILRSGLFRDFAQEELDQDPARLDTLLNTLEFFYKEPADNGAGGVSLTRQGVMDTISDVNFLLPSVRFLRALTRADELLRSQGRQPPSGSADDFLGSGRRYLYLFNHYPASRAGLSAGKGLYHAEDVAYEFDHNEFVGQSFSFGADDLTLTDTFRSLLSNFAKSGDPQVTVTQAGAGGAWSQFSLSAENYLSLEVVPRQSANLYGRKVALWDDLLPSLVNSTRYISPPRSWSLFPWSQGHQQQYGPAYGATPQSPMSYMFNGCMRFFRLN